METMTSSVVRHTEGPSQSAGLIRVAGPLLVMFCLIFGFAPSQQFSDGSLLPTSQVISVPEHSELSGFGTGVLSTGSEQAVAPSHCENCQVNPNAMTLICLVVFCALAVCLVALPPLLWRLRGTSSKEFLASRSVSPLNIVLPAGHTLKPPNLVALGISRT